MRDPFAWSIPLGRLFGITIRVHLLFPVIALALILRAACQKDAVPGAWVDAAVIMGLLFLSVLLHEFGHCFAARFVQGDATEILIWPLGGLARVDVPHNPRANFITSAAGPAVNLVLLLASALLLFTLADLQPPWNPFGYLARDGSSGLFHLQKWSGGEAPFPPTHYAVLLTQLFWVNWFLFLLNVVLIGFPLDGGRMFQAILWKYVGYRQATLAAVIAGFVTMFVVGLYSIVQNEVLALGLCIFIYVSCKHEWIVLETGGEDSLFGYDFSQGYTSLERDQPAAPVTAPPKPSWWERWRQKRAAKKLQRELERREAEERRMDQLLEKISSQGMSALSEEERRFMKQFSDQQRKNRHQ
jgi:Zn-dependent protease